jgi:malonate-semialdehyde dehydrogenase (acetylating)/methylmalonate-semialdehyde dehydrogenase
MKGEFTDGAGPGIDIYSMRQPLGVVAGITPFNFPAMIPMWMYRRPAIACGNAFILKPSERDPSVPMRLAELLHRGRPAGRRPERRQRRQGSGRRHPRPSRHQGRRLRRLDADRRVHLSAPPQANGKRVQCFGGAKNHMIIMPDADMDQAADALIGAGYGSAGERCMAISVAVPVGEETATRLIERLIPRVESLKIGPRPTRTPMGPGRFQGAGAIKFVGYIDRRRSRRRQAGRRRPRLQAAGLRERLLSSAAACSTCDPDMRIYKEEIFGPVLSVVRTRAMRRR